MKKEDEIILLRMADMQNKLEGFNKGTLKELLKTYTSLTKDLKKALGKAKAPSTKERALAMLKEIQLSVDAINATIAGETAQAVGLSGKWSYDSVNAITSWDGQTPGWNNLSLAAGQIEQLVTVQKLGGKVLEEWIGDALSPDLDTIKNEILKGQISGAGYKKTVKKIQDELNLSKKNKRDMESVVRTYTQSMNVKAQQDVFEANKNVVAKVEWSAIMENGNTKTGRGTCPRCMSLDGQQWRTDDYDRPPCPLHVRCRCMFLPITKTWKELGFDVEEMEEAYKPWNIRDKGRGIEEYGTTDKSYADWWAEKGKEGKKGEQFQDNAIGPVRAELVRGGAIRFEQLVVKNESQARRLKKATGHKYKNGDLIDVQDLATWKKFDASPAFKIANKKGRLVSEKKKLDEEAKATKKAALDIKDFPTMESLEESINSNIGIKSALSKQSRFSKAAEKESGTKKINLQIKAGEWEQEANNRKAKLIRDTVKPPKGGKVAINLRASTQGNATALREMFDDVADMFHPDVINKIPTVGINYIDGIRASHVLNNHAAKNHAITLGNTITTNTAVHEYGHAVEGFLNGALEKAIAFRKRRTVGESLKEIYPGEYGYEDKFFKHYCGKSYDMSTYRIGYRKDPTEIISMGVERMYSDPLSFYNEDKDYFEMITEIMWGKI